MDIADVLISLRNNIEKVPLESIEKSSIVQSIDSLNNNDAIDNKDRSCTNVEKVPILESKKERSPGKSIYSLNKNDTEDNKDRRRGIKRKFDSPDISVQFKRMRMRSKSLNLNNALKSSSEESSKSSPISKSEFASLNLSNVNGIYDIKQIPSTIECTLKCTNELFEELSMMTDVDDLDR